MANSSGHARARYGAAVLYNIATLISPRGLNVEQVLAWSEKTKYLRLALSDLPLQLEAAQAVSAGQGADHPESDVRIFDALPALRLGMALELTAHLVYSLTEVSANVANRATAKNRSALPGSFNDIRKMVDQGRAPEALVTALGDLSWYKKIREMRTEWAHYSAPFVAATVGDPQFRVYSQRPPSERKHLPEPALFSFDQYVHAVSGAVRATEGLAHYLVVEQVVPELDRAATRPYITKTSDGFPVIRGGKVVMEEQTIGELLKRCGIRE